MSIILDIWVIIGPLKLIYGHIELNISVTPYFGLQHEFQSF